MKHLIILAICISAFITGCDRVTPGQTRYPAPCEKVTNRVFFIPTFDDGPIVQKHVEEGQYPRTEDEMLASLYRTLKVLKAHNCTAVFYVVYVYPEPEAPEWSPKHSSEAMQRVFQRGVKAIADAGHAIALHGCDHDEYRKLFMSREKAKKDMLFLIAELDRAGVPYYRTWRVPYGGMRTFMNEQKVAKELGLSIRLWDIDGHDWTANHDSTNLLKKIFADEKKWTANVVKHLQSDVVKTKKYKRCWRDILLHVSVRTSSNLDEFLNAVQSKAQQVYSKPGDPKFEWLASNDPLRDIVLQDYLNNKPTWGRSTGNQRVRHNR